MSVCGFAWSVILAGCTLNLQTPKVTSGVDGKRLETFQTCAWWWREGAGGTVAFLAQWFARYAHYLGGSLPQTPHV